MHEQFTVTTISSFPSRSTDTSQVDELETNTEQDRGMRRRLDSPHSSNIFTFSVDELINHALSVVCQLGVCAHIVSILRVSLTFISSQMCLIEMSDKSGQTMFLC